MVLMKSMAIMLLASSCVTNKKVQYLQKNDVNARDIRTDSVLRNYNLKLYDYRIQPMDLLSIRIESATPEDFDFALKLNPVGQSTTGGGSQLLSGFLVDNNGDVEYPVIGKIKMAGLTVFEAQDKFKEVAAKYLKEPVVRVRLLNFRFTLIGEVNAEQQVTSFNTRISFSEAIGLGGGLGEYADRSNVKVIRQKGAETEIFYLNLLREDLLSADHYYVQQNDVIVVPPLKQRTFQLYFRQNLTLAAASLSALLLIVSLITK